MSLAMCTLKQRLISRYDSSYLSTIICYLRHFNPFSCIALWCTLLYYFTLPIMSNAREKAECCHSIGLMVFPLGDKVRHSPPLLAVPLEELVSYANSCNLQEQNSSHRAGITNNLHSSISLLLQRYLERTREKTNSLYKRGKKCCKLHLLLSQSFFKN
jgi:hypothetical protein